MIFIFILIFIYNEYRFGGYINDYPHPEADSQQFLKYIHIKNTENTKIYSPKKKCLRPWIEESVLQQEYYGGICSIM